MALGTEGLNRPAQASGVNAVGFFRAEFGHGEAARRILAGIDRAGIPHTTIAVKTPHHREKHPFTARGDRPVYSTNVVCLNPEHMLEFAQRGGAELFLDRYTIGVWCWEASRFPDAYRPAFDLVDEIWVASHYVAEVVGDATGKTVHVFPMPVEVAPPPPLTRKDVGLPEDRFVFLFAFDFFSTVERKNPFGLIEAFKRAFAPGEGPLLFIKTINGQKQADELKRLAHSASQHPDIRVVDDYVSGEQMRALVSNCDCFVSLHRSEGFGFSLAEALVYEKPVIATGYSGNLSFMNDENSYLVGFGLTPIPPGIPNYPSGALWADPDLDDAAAAMRRVIFRVLRPYLVRHREWESLVVEALRHQAEELKAQAGRIEELEASVSALENELNREALER